MTPRLATATGGGEGAAAAAGASTVRPVTVAGSIHVADETIHLRDHLQEMFEGHVITEPMPNTICTS